MYESVRPQPVISAARNGIGVAEVKLLKNAYVFMEKEARRLGLEVWMITIGDDLYEMDYADRLKTISEILKRLTKWQGRADIPQYSVNTIELLGSAGLHAHCAAIGNEQMIEKIKASDMIRPFCQGEDAIEKVYNWQGLSSYLSEERTTQANRSLQGAGIPLPDMKPPTKLMGAGDRVRLSDALKADVTEAGWQRPYSITHWKRKELVGITETPLSPRWVKDQAKKAAAQIEIRQSKPLHVTTMAVAGQISMFPDDRPVTRIRDYGGGFMPPSVAEKVEHHRRRLGFTQVQLAALIGICQPTFSNVIKGVYPLSGWAANRLRELLEQQRGMAA